METAVLERIESLLRQRREALVAEGNLEVGAEVDTARKADDDVAPHAEMAQVIASTRNRARTEELQEIESALRRLTDDPESFGMCDECDEPIGLQRIILMPWVRWCIECQQTRESDRPGSRRHLTDYR